MRSIARRGREQRRASASTLRRSWRRELRRLGAREVAQPADDLLQPSASRRPGRAASAADVVVARRASRSAIASASSSKVPTGWLISCTTPLASRPTATILPACTSSDCMRSFSSAAWVCSSSRAQLARLGQHPLALRLGLGALGAVAHQQRGGHVLGVARLRLLARLRSPAFEGQRALGVAGRLVRGRQLGQPVGRCLKAGHAARRRASAGLEVVDRAAGRAPSPAAAASIDVRAISASTWCEVAARCQSLCASDRAAPRRPPARPRRRGPGATARAPCKRSAPLTRSGKPMRSRAAPARSRSRSAPRRRAAARAPASARIWQASVWLREPSVPCSCGMPSSSSAIAASARPSPSRIEPVCIRHQPVDVRPAGGLHQRRARGRPRRARLRGR